MLQLNYERDIEISHSRYFKNEVLSSLLTLKTDPYVFTDSEIAELLVDLSYNRDVVRFKKKFQKQQTYLYGYIKNNHEIFSEGRLDQLKKLDEQIRKNFPLIVAIVQNTSPKKYKGFKKYFSSLFCYEKFKMKSLYQYFFKKSKSILGAKRFSPKVRKQMIEQLIICLPHMKTQIKADLEKSSTVTAKSFEKAFKSLPYLHLTLSNFRNFDVFSDDWNDYLLILNGNIKVCPYCNRQYISPFYSDNGKVRADFDHFLPKSIYPYFSISLYNIVPSCKQCNQSLKRAKDFSFESINPFERSFNDFFRFIAMPNADSSKICIELDIVDEKISEHIDVFKIEPLYNYHRNHAEELIEKRRVYNEHCLKNLYENHFKGKDKSINSVEDLKKSILGFNLELHTLNDEPLSKFKRDLAIQLGFLEEKDSRYRPLPQNLIDELERLVN